MTRTHYDVLGVARDATEREIRRAYRRRIFELHPDLRGEDSDDIRELNEARDVLADAARRRVYDRRLDRVDVAEAEPAVRGLDMLARIELDVRLAAVGGSTVVTVTRPGQPDVDVPIVVPPSAEPGLRWTLAGAGQPGRPPGDLVVELAGYAEGPLRRAGDDIEGDLVVTLAQAYAGAVVVFDGAWGAVALRLRAAEPPPPVVRVAGHGWRGPGRAGDLVLRTVVRWPPAGDAALLRALQRACSAL